MYLGSHFLWPCTSFGGVCGVLSPGEFDVVVTIKLAQPRIKWEVFVRDRLDQTGCEHVCGGDLGCLSWYGKIPVHSGWHHSWVSALDCM